MIDKLLFVARSLAINTSHRLITHGIRDVSPDLARPGTAMPLIPLILGELPGDLDSHNYVS